MLLTSMADVYCLLKVRNACVRLYADLLPQDLKGHSKILTASKSVLLCTLNGNGCCNCVAITQHPMQPSNNNRVIGLRNYCDACLDKENVFPQAVSR